MLTKHSQLRLSHDGVPLMINEYKVTYQNRAYCIHEDTIRPIAVAQQFFSVEFGGVFIQNKRISLVGQKEVKVKQGRSVICT